MISLDKNILDKNSAAAKRMVAYGAQSDLFIIVPHTQKQIIELSEKVKGFATGGNKIQQFFRLKKIGKEILQKNKISAQGGPVSGWDLITTQDPFFTGLVGVCLRQKTGVKLEVQLHGDFFSSDYYKKSGCKNWLQYYIAKFLVIKKADKLRVVGERIKKSLLNLGIEENKIEVRPIAINEELISAKGGNYQPKINLHAKYPNYEKIFLSIGRLDSVKNIIFLIDVFAQVVKEKPNYLLLIVGDGVEKNKLQEQVNNFGLENNIKFENWTQDSISYIKTADCVLFPSLSEGYGLVAMEATAAGTRLIMNDVGVANFELKPSKKVKIVPLDKEVWIKEILTIL